MLNENDVFGSTSKLNHLVETAYSEVPSLLLRTNESIFQVQNKVFPKFRQKNQVHNKGPLGFSILSLILNFLLVVWFTNLISGRTNESTTPLHLC